MVVRTKRFITAGAAFARIDLAMSIVSDISPQLAEDTARLLLIDDRPARALEAALGHLADTDEIVSRFEEEVRRRLDGPISIEEIAFALDVTRRTLERYVRERTATTPNRIVQRLRVERARHLRRTTDLPMARIAELVGYTSSVTLRRLLARAGTT